MAHGRGEAQWNQTSLIASLIVNTTPTKKKRKPIPPSRFNPYAELEVRRTRGVRTGPVTPERAEKMLRELDEKERRARGEGDRRVRLGPDR